MNKKIISLILLVSLMLSASSLVFATKNDDDNPYVIINPPHSTNIGK